MAALNPTANALAIGTHGPPRLLMRIQTKDLNKLFMGYVTNNSIERRTPLKSKTAVKRGGKLGRKKICLWVGKKTLEWMRVRVQLKKKFAAAGITSCELGYPGCWKDEALGFAHGRKRRHLKGNEIETLTILICNPCHDRIEVLPAAGMLAVVQSVITERGWGQK